MPAAQCWELRGLPKKEDETVASDLATTIRPAKDSGIRRHHDAVSKQIQESWTTSLYHAYPVCMFDAETFKRPSTSSLMTAKKSKPTHQQYIGDCWMPKASRMLVNPRKISVPRITHSVDATVLAVSSWPIKLGRSNDPYLHESIG